MSLYPPSDVAVKNVGLFQYCDFDGQRFKRKRGAEKWEPVQPEKLPAETSQTQPLLLCLILHRQAPGEPNHWCLFVARENDPGMVYQVKGDAECMSYQPSDERVREWLSDSFRVMFEIAILTDQTAATVQQVAEREPPPRAERRRDVRENCQGWTVRVLEKLAARGIVTDAKVEMARSMVEEI